MEQIFFYGAVKATTSISIEITHDTKYDRDYVIRCFEAHDCLSDIGEIDTSEGKITDKDGNIIGSWGAEAEYDGMGEVEWEESHTAETSIPTGGAE